MEQWLTRVWYRESAGPSPLQPLSWLYGVITGIRRQAYTHGVLKSLRAGKPVIVVGNLTVGGTGKTPLVAWLAGQLSVSGLKVGIVSRGYGRSSREPVVVHVESDWRDVGDEPVLLRQLTGCDTVVAQDRVAGARKLVELGADVVIADDGLQHLRLARDCEIVVVDGARGFGNGRLLPAGPLREPASRLRDADIVVINGVSVPGVADAVSAGALRMSLFGAEAHRVDGLAAPMLLEHLRGRRAHAVAGIGNPQRFFQDLLARGIEIIEHPYPDHHPFVAADLTFDDGLPVLMTQKDAVKCRSCAHSRLWYVPVTARFDDSQARELLGRVIQTLAPSKLPPQAAG
jgi:tetraacyldisaccharide 4'-kinase